MLQTQRTKQRPRTAHHRFAAACLVITALLSTAIAACADHIDDDNNNDAGSTPPVAANALRNIDITVVYPLPAPDALDDLMRPTTPGRDGALLTADVFDRGGVPELDVRAALATDAARLDALRVVAVRFDPCAGVVMPPAAPATCQPQIRLIFQSLLIVDDTTIARDGAVHAFYALSADDFDVVLQELRAVRAAHATDAPVPLGIHPVLQAEGLSGPYATRLRALITRFCGAPHLVRVTHFRRTARDVASWDFALRERSGDRWSDGVIATTTQTTESLLTIAGGRWDAVATPTISHADDPTRVFRVDLSEEADAFTAVARVLDPRVHSSESIDCASCHIAGDIERFGTAVRGLPSTPFTSTHPLDSAERSEDEAIGFENIHMLSWFGASFSVSPRVANETATILEHLDRE